MSAEISYHALCHDFYGKFQACMEKTNGDENRAFAPRGTAAEVLTEHALQGLYQAIGHSPDSRDQRDTFVEIVKREELNEFLATLLFAGCSYQAAVAFASKILQRNGLTGTAPPVDPPPRNTTESSLWGEFSLPATQERLFEILGDQTDVEKFRSKQACFCPVVLEKGAEARLEAATSVRLPYLEERLRGKGSFGKVYSVRIAKGHFRDPAAQTGFRHTSDTVDLARKDFRISEGFPGKGKDERKIMDTILHGSMQRCVNIMENWGSLQVGDVYQLFMPLAVCDLRAYMMEQHTAKPMTMREKAEILECAEGLARALKFLHHEMKTPDHERMVCYHMDLKPSNILVFQLPDNEKKIWKLSDFGMSRVKIHRAGQSKAPERDFTHWFTKRVEDRQPSVSATVNQRGAGTYLAPESEDSNRSMTAKSDVWSLGCILSIIMSYLDDGKHGIDGYAQERSEHSGANDTKNALDPFFVSSMGWKPHKPNPAIKSWHKKLVDKASGRSHAEKQALRDILDFLESSIFQVSPEKRCQAPEVVSALESACRAYYNIGRDSVQAAGAIQGAKDASDENHDGQAPHVDSWALNTTTPSKGCAISADAEVVAYWSDDKIMIYSSKSLRASAGNATVDVAADYSDERANYFWKSIDLTSNYLLACVTESWLLYIFNLRAGNGGDVSLQTPMVISLGVREIYKVSVSSDKRHIALVVLPDNESGTVSILTALLPELTGYAKRAMRDTSSNGRPARAVEIPPEMYQMVDLECSASEVQQVTMVGSEKIYIIVQPVVSAVSREHVIPITLVKLSGTDIHVSTVKVKSQGLHAESSRFYTCFCPLQLGASCAVITRQNRLHILDPLRPDSGGDKEQDISKYRVLKLIPTGQGHSLIYAIGRRSNRDKLLLLEISIQQQGHEVAIREIETLNHLSRDDDFMGVLVQLNGQKFVLVAALVSPDKRSIHRVTISASS